MNMNPTPNPHVHGGDHLREGVTTVVAIDITGTADHPNTGVRVRAELTLDELVELHAALGRRLEGLSTCSTGREG